MFDYTVNVCLIRSFEDSDLTTELESAKERLLEAAQEVFAERGYAAASVRDICGQAGVNIAAVNYYFGDKERLYIEAVKTAHSCAMAEPPMPEWPAGYSPWQKLREFIGVVVQRIMRDQKPHLMQLVMRELSQPTAACAEVVRDSIRPMADVLMSILSELMPGVRPEECYMFGFSVMGQILIHKQNRPVVRGLMGDDAHDRLTTEHIAQHIFAIMQAGIEARLRREAAP